jgi:hypothetical protein
MDHDKYYALMMDALDEMLSAENRVLLDLHLTDCAPAAGNGTRWWPSTGCSIRPRC